MNIRKRLMKRIDPIKTKIQQQTNANTAFDAKDWQPVTWPPMPGHVWAQVDQIDFVRGLFLREIKHPKMILKDESQTKQLCYIFTKESKQKDTRVTHALPQDGNDMILWLQNLNIGLVYKGEGLPALAYKVRNKLTKHTWMKKNSTSC